MEGDGKGNNKYASEFSKNPGRSNLKNGKAWQTIREGSSVFPE